MHGAKVDHIGQAIDNLIGEAWNPTRISARMLLGVVGQYRAQLPIDPREFPIVTLDDCQAYLDATIAARYYQ